jgi:hypothetical protein
MVSPEAQSSSRYRKARIAAVVFIVAYFVNCGLLKARGAYNPGGALGYTLGMMVPMIPTKYFLQWMIRRWLYRVVESDAGHIGLWLAALFFWAFVVVPH